MRKCKAMTKAGKSCTILVEDWRQGDLCHVHDPNGKLKKQAKNKGYRDHTKLMGCHHKWYMRELGITCINCGVIWEKGMDE